MASACVNNISMSPENFSSGTYPSYGWLSPRISFSREEDTSKQSGSSNTVSCDAPAEDPPEILDSVDFEFRLEDPVTMLPADELFSDGKLVPLTTIKPANALSEIRSPETAKSCRRMEMEISVTDPCLFSPKAPRCSSRWKELLGLKKLYQNANTKADAHKTTSSSSSNPIPKSLKHFLHRSSKSCSCNSSSLDHSLSLPLLKDTECESVSISSSRLSLSSSSSSHEHEDLPRLSLESEKPNPSLNVFQDPNPNPFVLNRNPNQNPLRMRMVKPRSETNSNSNNSNNSTSATRVGRSPMRRAAGESSGVTSRGVSVDSPRMNSSGKIVFQSLERSSSSPSSFNGGSRFKHRGMERSYSANVRVTPVINVPVCSLRGTSKSVSVFGFGQLFSSPPQKREWANKGQQQHGNSRNRIDRA
ncbi:hypothetical protein P3X46_030440 [Hevea brasiliensis]|uniref:DUF4005 domain-containing protein n=1 Tax=Hevea brasiliensis TaxID=3981 RepID=A0ABQ9KIJ6_HEVBR|nr:uncharacterized protein LOC110661245 [Hevea brasiliensis]XP_057995811.1 uncharacterized protein LOC110661245 [Hevea brasiliensis]XP_057995812.1 uncharacterized protein LOC110661245 [Hevea brasiliensis]KAJ9139735.1 hypothetical protein P3X46_030440 [Hevea brasiliensis]